MNFILFYFCPQVIILASSLKMAYYTMFSLFPDATIEQANWDVCKVRDKLLRDIEAHASQVRSKKLSEVVEEFEVPV